MQFLGSSETMALDQFTAFLCVDEIWFYLKDYENI